MTTAIQDRLPRLTKFLYGISDFGFACTDTTMQVLFAIFMTDVVGLKPIYAAAAIFIGRTWDYINDPLVGFLTDRTRTRWGRRRPYLLIGFIPFGSLVLLVFYIFESEGPNQYGDGPDSGPGTSAPAPPAPPAI